MSIYISYHSLDLNFAHELLTYVRNLGYDATLCSSQLLQNLDQIISYTDKLIVILRPDYLQSSDYLTVCKLLHKISGFFPVLRAPISVNEWSANAEFRPVIDFTDRENPSLEQLKTVLSTNNDEPGIQGLTLKAIYLNNLENVLRTYIKPLISLEAVNYERDIDRESGINILIQRTMFRVRNAMEQTDRGENPQWNRKDYLDNIAESYRSFAITCNDFDRSAIAYYLVESARHQATINPNAPIPVFLDVENWPENIAWTEWLSNQITFSNTPLEDVASGKCLVYAYGLDFYRFKTHPRKADLEEWLYGANSPRHFIIICANLPNLGNHLIPQIIITPVEYDLNTYRDLCVQFPERPFSQFVISAIDHQIVIPAFNYLLLNPILAASLLSVKFDDGTKFEELGVQEYFQTLIQNLWQTCAQRDHEVQIDFTEIKELLSRLAVVTTEQQRTSFGQEYRVPSTPSKLVLSKCFDADFLSKGSELHFSMPFIQHYFAACGLIEFGVPSHLPNLTIDKQCRRIPQRWDNPVIISSHISERKDEMLQTVVKADPMLALLCIVSGISVSSSSYSLVIEQNLNSLVTLGDFRVDFAKHLYHIDPKAGKAILIEVMRDAHWSIRIDAYKTFIELERSFLPGLAEAIEQLTDNTRHTVAQALQRIGPNALSTLFTMLRSDNSILRLNAVWAMGELHDKACLPALVEATQDNDFRVSKQVIATFDLLQDINCVPYLVQCLRTQHTGISKNANKVLRHLQENKPDIFVSLVKNMNANSKILVVQAMRGTSSDAFVGLLLALSEDENVDVRLAATKELGSYQEDISKKFEDCLVDMSKSKLSKSTVGEIVSKVLSNIQQTSPRDAVNKSNNVITEDKSLRSSAIVKARLLQVKEVRTKGEEISEEIDGHLTQTSSQGTTSRDAQGTSVADDSYVSAILAQLRERTWTNSNNAAKILREYVKGLHGSASLNVINQILETLNDKDWVIRWTGVETLGWTGNVNVVPHLVQRLTDTNWKIRIAAIRSLSEIGDHTAVTGLIALLSDNNSVVREASAEALGVLNASQALPALETATLDQEDFVRLAAIESIGKLQQRAATKILLTALKDKSEHVRWAAANGLSGMANSEMVSFLIPSLSDTGGPYWEQKRICDVIVDILKQIGSDEALSAIANRGNNHA